MYKTKKKLANLLDHLDSSARIFSNNSSKKDEEKTTKTEASKDTDVKSPIKKEAEGTN